MSEKDTVADIARRASTLPSLSRHSFRRPRTLRNLVVLAGASLIIGIWAAVVVLIWTEREEAIEEARLDAGNLAMTFEEHIARSLTEVDQLTRFLKVEYEEDRASFRFQDWLQRLPITPDLISQVAIIGADGKLRASSLDAHVAPIDLSDRSHFRFHVEHKTDSLFIGAPVLGKISKRWSVQLSRRLNGPDGELAGVLVVSLDPKYLINFYDSINVGANGSITLLGLDGMVRARADRKSRQGDSDWPLSMRDSEVFNHLASAPHGTYVTKGTSGVADRLAGYRLVRDYPLVVVVSYSVDDILTAPGALARKMIVVSAAITLFLGALTAYLVVEINRRARREEELAAQHRKLDEINHHLQAVNRELIESKDAAEAANRAKSIFLAQMSHELRTPLNAIIGFSEIIGQEMFGPAGNGHYVEYAEHINTSGSHLLAVINDILDLSKAEAGRLELREETVDLDSLLATCETALRPQANKGDVQVSVEAPAVVRQLRGDEAKLRQIFLNILSNAVKFTPRGGMITVATAKDADGACRISVADTGIGMTVAEIALALEPFRQIDSNLSRQHDGTGLGLPLTKRLVELHGGKLEIASIPGQGTTVTVALPAERALANAPETNLKAAV